MRSITYIIEWLVSSIIKILMTYWTLMSMFTYTPYRPTWKVDVFKYTPRTQFEVNKCITILQMAPSRSNDFMVFASHVEKKLHSENKLSPNIWQTRITDVSNEARITAVTPGVKRLYPDALPSNTCHVTAYIAKQYGGNGQFAI